MRTEFQIACDAWERKVDKIAAELVRNGVPPYDAMTQARKQVQAKGRIKQSGEDAMRQWIKERQSGKTPDSGASTAND